MKEKFAAFHLAAVKESLYNRTVLKRPGEQKRRRGQVTIVT